MKHDEFIAALVNAGVTVHRDMEGPADLFGDRAVTARSRRISDEDLITELTKAVPVNFSFYMRMGDVIRFAIWKD
jgi:hypothetical protein